MRKKSECLLCTSIVQDKFIVIEYKHSPYGAYTYHKISILNEAGKNRKVKRLCKLNIPHEIFIVGERILLQA
jgi:hypothetical protein